MMQQQFQEDNSFLSDRIQTTETQSSLEPSLQFRNRAWFDSLKPEDKMNYMFDNDTQEVIDLRTSEAVEYCNITLNKQAAWKDYWKQSQKYTLELLKACKKGQLDVVKLILTQQTAFIDINAKDSSDWTCLHFACSLGHYQIAFLLIENGALIDEQDHDGHTPLILSVKGNYQNIGDLLLHHKSNPNLQDYSLNTSLHLAVENNCIEFINLLLRYKADPKIQNNTGLTPLHLISNTEQLRLFQSFGFQKLNRSEELSMQQNQDGLNTMARKSVNRIMKFLGQTVSTYELQQERYSAQPRTSHVPIGGGNINYSSFTYHKELGKGSFGIVYLVKRKESSDKTLYAMKVLRKDKISTKLLPYIQTEKSILGVVDHPFIVKLHYAFQNQSKLFLVMDFCSGGDLTKLLDLKNRLTEDVTRMYVAEIILAIEALHKNKIMYRDMKPQNIIIDSNGHCMLTDFGLAKTEIEDDSITKSFCGTPAYMAPEVVNKKLYNRSVDWYQLGTITHEMLYGVPPFYSHNREELFENIKNKVLKFPTSVQVSKEGQSFMQQLLERNPSKRLGAKKDADEVRAHPWFKNINWNDVYNKKLPVPPPSFANQANATIEVEFEVENDDPRRPIDNWTFIS